MTVVMKKPPIEIYLPWREYVLGRLCNAFPGLILAMVGRAVF